MPASPIRHKEVTNENFLRTSYQRFNMMADNEATQRVQGQKIFNQGDLVERHREDHKPARVYEDNENNN